MDRRKERRLDDLELSVQIWGVDRNSRPYAELVRATSVSDSGASSAPVSMLTHWPARAVVPRTLKASAIRAVKSRGYNRHFRG